MSRKMLCSDTGKVIYFNEAAVKKAIKQRPAVRLRQYRCPKCKYFHLTKQRASGYRTLAQTERYLVEGLQQIINQTWGEQIDRSIT